MKTFLYSNFSQIITLSNAHNKDGRNLKAEDLSIIKNGSIIFNEDEILWVGETDQIPSNISISEEKKFDNKILLPEIVDSHTHLVFGGDRSFEYGMRLNGAGYEELAKAGGGILHTMEKTGKSSREELFEIAKKRIETIYSYGIGTIEIKSGYGLTYEKEKELSLVIHDLKRYFAPRIQIFNTYMAAHAVPKIYSSSNEYLSKVVIPLLEDLAPQNIIDAVDIFHEKGYFDDKDVENLCKVAQKNKINIKMHVDEFYTNGGAELAAKYGALSADHLLCTKEEGIQALKNSSTVATVLPGTGLFLGKKAANARQFLDNGVKVAMASDYNPGSCHCDNLLLLSSIAAPMYQMNQGELWAAVTLNAAHALNFKNQGALLKGLKPRFSIFNVPTIDHLSYNWGKNFSINQFSS